MNVNLGSSAFILCFSTGNNKILRNQGKSWNF